MAEEKEVDSGAPFAEICEDVEQLKRLVARQKDREELGLFNPYKYFGALGMPEIPPEDQPADQRIQSIFNDPLINKTKKQLKHKSPKSSY